MNVIEVLHDKSKKLVEKRAALVDAIKDGAFSVADISALPELTEKDISVILEAMEETERIIRDPNRKRFTSVREAR